MKKYLLFGLLVIALAVLPSLHLFTGLKIYDEKRLFEVVLLSVAALIFMSDQFVGFNQFLPGCGMPRPYGINLYVRWGMGLFFALGLVSLVFNGGWYHGLQELSLYVMLLCFFIYIAKIYCQNPVRFTNAMGLLLGVLGGLYALKFFIGYGMHLFTEYPLWPGKSYQYKFFGFANKRFFNQLQAWTLPLLVGWAGNSKKTLFAHSGAPLRNAAKASKLPSNGRSLKIIKKYFFFFLAALWWCLVIQSAGRGVLLSLLVAPLVVLLIIKEKSHRYVKKYLYAFVTGAMLKLLFFNILASNGISESLARDSGSAGRLGRWGKMLVDIGHQPFIGYSPMSFAKISERYHAGHPHNSVLQIAYEFGIPAACIVLGLILWGLYTWFHQLSGHSMERPRASKEIVMDQNIIIRIGISTALLAGLGYSLFSGVIVMPLSQLWMVLIGGWALGMYHYRDDLSFSTVGRQATSVPSGSKAKTSISALVLAAIVWMGVVVWHDVPRLKENQQQYIQRYDGKYHPRFWQQGKIGIEK